MLTVAIAFIAGITLGCGVACGFSALAEFARDIRIAAECFHRAKRDELYRRQVQWHLMHDEARP